MIKMRGTISGYEVSYDCSLALCWVVYSKAHLSGNRPPYILANFRSQDDMEYLMKDKMIWYKKV
jgi:hypothetical protein